MYFKETGLRLSITCDESTSTRNCRFMNINAHFEKSFKSLGLTRVHGSLPGHKAAELGAFNKYIHIHDD